MGKILLLAIAIWLLVVVLKRYRRSMEASTKTAEPVKPENMVQCAHCGVHLPKSDSLLINKQYYCCEAHSKQSGHELNR